MNGKMAYPIIISKSKNKYLVKIPDFNMTTEGDCIVVAIQNAREVIGLHGMELLDNDKELPTPSTDIFKEKEEILTLVDVDFVEYKRKYDNKAVKKNCTLPYWIAKKAEGYGINFSKVLQDSLIDIFDDKDGHSSTKH